MEYTVEVESEGCPAGPVGTRVTCSDRIDPSPGAWVLIEGPGNAPALAIWPSRHPWMATIATDTGVKT